MILKIKTFQTLFKGSESSHSTIPLILWCILMLKKPVGLKVSSEFNCRLVRFVLGDRTKGEESSPLELWRDSIQVTGFG